MLLELSYHAVLFLFIVENRENQVRSNVNSSFDWRWAKSLQNLQLNNQGTLFQKLEEKKKKKKKNLIFSKNAAKKKKPLKKKALCLLKRSHYEASGFDPEKSGWTFKLTDPPSIGYTSQYDL